MGAPSAAGAAPDPIEALLDRAYRYALVLTHDPSRAEDLLQDAVVNVLRRDGPRTVGYLLATVRNRFIDILRRKARVTMRPLADGETPPALVLLGQPDEEVDPERMQTALGELRPLEREVLYLAYVEEHTAQEIADLMACPRGTVLSLMHRARGKMKSLLGDATSGEGAR